MKNQDHLREEYTQEIAETTRMALIIEGHRIPLWERTRPDKTVTTYSLGKPGTHIKRGREYTFYPLPNKN
ncbi:MAG: hypothetical protein N3D20_01165 [Candidatus Pacearchaeota archaeon]|nr:hypothetical protein [Candidatus Pacearchaeota archaeon]